MRIREVLEMTKGSEQSAEVPAETERPGVPTAELKALTETGETGKVTAEPEAPQRTFTARSRKSIQTEQRLEKELARRNGLKRLVEDAIDTLGRDKKRLLKLVMDGEAWADKALSDTLGKIDAEKRKLTLFTEEASEAQANLDNFRAGIEAYAPERARRQGYLADLAGARLKVDCELEGLLRKALTMLEVREQVVSLMREQAAAIDLTCSFEAGVPASLHAALSLGIMSGSVAWNARFLGEEKHLTPYIVSAESFEPEETLTRKAVYSFGETVYLLEEEAAEFLRSDRPRPGGRDWECLPPTLMTAEAFAAAQAESGRTGPILRYVLQQRHGELEQKRREAYLLARRGTPTPGQHLGGR